MEDNRIKKISLLLLTLLTVCLLTACSGDEIMRERFGDSRPKILYDVKTGDKYIIRHHIGDTYSVVPLIE